MRVAGNDGFDVSSVMPALSAKRFQSFQNALICKKTQKTSIKNNETQQKKSASIADRTRDHPGPPFRD